MLNEIKSISVQDFLKNNSNLIDNQLLTLLNNEHFASSPGLLDIVKYSSLECGKRLRASLCIATYLSFAKDSDKSFQDCLTVASSIEVVHSMSLIHDDLPCMDDDDFRRGKLSTHKKFGEANALLAGDAMISLANLFILQIKALSSQTKLSIVEELSNTFTFGLVPGQILDLEYEDKKCDIKTIENIYRLKTASLIKSSVISGALICFDQNLKSSKTQNEIIHHLTNFGFAIGNAFQIIDDILDVTGDFKTLGKTAGKDISQNKKTFPSVLGVDESRKKAIEMISYGKSELTKISDNTKLLFDLADFIIERIN